MQDIADGAIKTYGQGTITPANKILNHKCISTGIFSLDYALLGGIPEGQMALFSGWESAGKTTFSLKALANFHKKYPESMAIFVDLETSFDAEWAEAQGVDLDRLYVVSGESGEQVVDIVSAAYQAENLGFIIIDSLAEMIGTREINASAYDDHVAPRAKIVNKLIADYVVQQSKRVRLGMHPLTVILINQYRSKAGFFMGDPTTLPGGHWQRFKANTVIHFQLKKEEIGKDTHDIDIVTSNEHSFKIKKSKVGNSIRGGEFEMIRIPTNGLSIGDIADQKTVLTYMKKTNMIRGGGQAWYIAGIDQKFNKMEAMIDFMINHPETYDKYKAALIALRRLELGLTVMPPDNFLICEHAPDEEIIPTFDDIKDEPHISDLEAQVLVEAELL